MAASAEDLTVLIVADSDDPHAAVVATKLDIADCRYLRYSYSDVSSFELRWSPEPSLTISKGGHDYEVTRDTTVWWRRPGVPDSGVMDPDEAALCFDEVHAIIPSALESVKPRWVDSPSIQWAAGQKLIQLTTAARIGIRIPATFVTNSPRAARVWASQVRAPIVAKATSSGYGIAPYVDVVASSELDRIGACPTMLQELVTATSDVRVVTVAGQAFTWQRTRDSVDGPDWRRADPTGTAFVPVELIVAERAAGQMADELGLSFSVQDWLVGDDGLTFLEVNPQGQWLFLSDAEARVSRHLAEHLVGPVQQARL